MVQEYRKGIALNTWGCGQSTVFQMTCSWKVQNNNVQSPENKPLRRYLTTEAAAILVLGLIMPHIDYCNSLFAVLPETDITKLQRVQNIAARFVSGIGERDRITAFHRNLYWLPIHSCIDYEILTLVHKCTITGQALECLCSLLIKPVIRRQGLRSNKTSQYKLIVPGTKRKTLASRSFSMVGPTNWNNLPLYLRCIDSTDQFKKELKTYLFKVSYRIN